MKRALVVLLLSSPGLLSGQEPQSIDTLTLAEAIRLATANSPVYGQVSNDQGAADWGVRSAYARFLPSFFSRRRFARVPRR
jgi:hypothetical protein